jgi:hypothetical protein
MVLAASTAHPAQAPGEATVEAEIEILAGDVPAAVRIGERVSLLLRLEIPAGFEVGEPRLAGDTEEFVLLATGEESGSAAPGGGLMKQIPLIVVPFQVGEIELPGVVVSWAGPDGRAGEARTGPLTLQVEPTVADPGGTPPADIRDPAGLAVPRRLPWLAALGAALVATALAGWWWWRRRRTDAPAVLPPIDPFDGLTPSEWALRALDRLLQEDTLGLRGAEAYHVELAEIVRRYLSGQYRLDALEHTTTEILQGVEEHLDPLPGTRGRLRQVLSGCDLVKFARLNPGRREALALAGAARQFVEETRPRESPVTEEP